MPPQNKPYLGVVRHLEWCLETYGDTHRGVDWPVEDDVPTRHRVMLDVIRDWPPGRSIRLLDFGCGASGFQEYLLERGIEIDYSGLDLSEKFIELSESKFPENDYYCVDILEQGVDLPHFDYITMNGVFTVKGDLSFGEMSLLQQAPPRGRRGSSHPHRRRWSTIRRIGSWSKIRVARYAGRVAVDQPRLNRPSPSAGTSPRPDAPPRSSQRTPSCASSSIPRQCRAYEALSR